MINEKFFKDCENELCEYNDYLPNIIRSLISKEYYINLWDCGKYDVVSEQIDATRKYSKQESLEELRNWCKNNPKYNDLINK